MRESVHKGHLPIGEFGFNVLNDKHGISSAFPNIIKWISI